jgi:hypothetical protein
MLPSMEELAAYRETLLRGREAASRSFDDWLVKLSAGALAIALGFVRTTSPAREQWALVASWVLLTVGLALMLASFRTSLASFTTALKQGADSLKPERLWQEKPGGFWRVVTDTLTYASAVCVIAGVSVLGYFVTVNLENLR